MIRFRMNCITQASKFPNKKEYFKKVVNELVLTLNSRAKPYSNVSKLASDFEMDSFLNSAQVAIDFGFISFEQFVKSEKLRKYFLLDINSSGETIFVPFENEKFKHIRENQNEWQVVADQNFNKHERDKIARAMKPENLPTVLEGKRRLIHILADLGGEKTAISFQDLQNAYKNKFDTPLNKKELIRLFQRSTLSRIIMTLFSNEVELFAHNEYHGMLFLQLKKPLQEILDSFEENVEYQKKYEEFKNQKPNTLPDRHRYGPKKPPKDLSSLHSVLPGITSIYGKNEFDFEDSFDESNTDLNKNNKTCNNNEKNENDILQPNIVENNFEFKSNKWYSKAEIGFCTSSESEDNFSNNDNISNSLSKGNNSLNQIVPENSEKDFVNFSNKQKLDTNSVASYRSYTCLRSKKLTLQRKKALASYILCLTKYHSPKSIDVEYLLKVLERLDSDYHLILDDHSIINFIQKHCNNIKITKNLISL